LGLEVHKLLLLTSLDSDGSMLGCLVIALFVYEGMAPAQLLSVNEQRKLCMEMLVARVRR
jgi:hypothetical protein